MSTHKDNIFFPVYIQTTDSAVLRVDVEESTPEHEYIFSIMDKGKACGSVFLNRQQLEELKTLLGNM